MHIYSKKYSALQGFHAGIDKTNNLTCENIYDSFR